MKLQEAAVIEADALLDAVPVMENVQFVYTKDGAPVNLVKEENGNFKISDDCLEAESTQGVPTAVVTMIKEGFSRNGRLNSKKQFVRRYYSAEAIKTFVEWHKQRYRQYSGHLTEGPGRFDRPIESTVSIITKNSEGERNVWVDKDENGKLVAKAVVRFTEFDLGKQIYREAKRSPEDVKLSINAKVRATLNKTVEDQPADIIEACGFLYSSDYVSYPGVPGAGVNGVTENESYEAFESHAGEFNMDAVEAFGKEGFYNVVESWNEKGETYTESTPEPENTFSKIVEAFKSISTRMKEKEVRQKYWEVMWSFRTIVTEIFKDEKKEYQTTDKKRGAFNEASKQLGDYIFALDESALVSSMKSYEAIDDIAKFLPANEDKIEKIKTLFGESEEETNEENKEGDINMELFKTHAEAAADEKVIKLVLDAVDINSLELTVGESKMKVSDLVKAFKDMQENSVEQDKFKFFTLACQEYGLSNPQVEIMKEAMEIDAVEESENLTDAQQSLKNKIFTRIKNYSEKMGAALAEAIEAATVKDDKKEYSESVKTVVKKFNKEKEKPEEVQESQKERLEKQAGMFNN